MRIIVLTDLENDFLASIDETEFNGLKNVFRKASSLLWLTAGGLITGANPKAALMVGLIRAITTEMPLVKFARVDIDPDYDRTSNEIADMILSKENALQSDSHSESIDGEFVFKDGIFHFSRLVADSALNHRFLGRLQQLSSTKLVSLKSQGHLGIDFDHVGLLSSLYFKKDDHFSLPLDQDEIEIEIMSVGLNVKVKSPPIYNISS